MEFIRENWAGISTLIISIVALSVAIKSWRKSRNIYDIERYLYFRKPKGVNNNKRLKEKLNSGEYTILHSGEYGGYIELILGKLKK